MANNPLWNSIWRIKDQKMNNFSYIPRNMKKTLADLTDVHQERLLNRWLDGDILSDDTIKTLDALGIEKSRLFANFANRPKHINPWKRPRKFSL